MPLPLRMLLKLHRVMLTSLRLSLALMILLVYVSASRITRMLSALYVVLIPTSLLVQLLLKR